VAKQQNATAMANLTMTFTSKATMGLVFKAKITEWPEVGTFGRVSSLQEISTSRHYHEGRVETAVECGQDEEK
jgi:hypothetical protein